MWKHDETLLHYSQLSHVWPAHRRSDWSAVSWPQASRSLQRACPSVPPWPIRVQQRPAWVQRSRMAQINTGVREKHTHEWVWMFASHTLHPQHTCELQKLADLVWTEDCSTHTHTHYRLRSCSWPTDTHSSGLSSELSHRETRPRKANKLHDWRLCPVYTALRLMLPSPRHEPLVLITCLISLLKYSGLNNWSSITRICDADKHMYSNAVHQQQWQYI